MSWVACSQEEIVQQGDHRLTCQRGQSQQQGRGGSHGCNQPGPSPSPSRVRGNWEDKTQFQKVLDQCLLLTEARHAWDWPLGDPSVRHGVSGENPEQRLSDNKGGRELSEVREVGTRMAYLPSPPGSSERGRVQDTRGWGVQETAAPTHSSLAQAGILRSQY